MSGHPETPSQAGALLRETAVPEAGPPRAVGAYEIVRRLGSGGMGTVYEAVQPELGRRVALKVVREGALSRSTLDRFRFEATVLSRLRHRNIAQIHDAGVARVDGAGEPVPYYAMELVEDARPIHHHARRAGLGLDDRLRLLADVADAVHHGHQRGVIHRDLKPDNILVGADGVPKVIDFGIAASILPDPNATLAQTFHTRADQILGSLQWLAPEQLDSPDVDVRADVHALGLVLYMMVAGRLPYDVSRLPFAAAASAIKTAVIPSPWIRRNAKDAPSRPRDRKSRNLDAVVLKALDREPRWRHQSATDLADDLRALANGNPVSARPPSLWQRGTRWIGKHPLGATVVASAVLVLCSFAAVNVYAWWLLVRPDHLQITPDRGSAKLRTRKERTLYTWPSNEVWKLIDIDSTRDLNGHLRIAVAEQHGVEHTARLLWVDARSPSYPSVHALDRMIPPSESAPPGIPRSGWLPTQLIIADLLPPAGNEVVLPLRHPETFISAILIYSPQQRRTLYASWHSGHIADVVFLPRTNQLVCTGYSNLLPWKMIDDSGASQLAAPVVTFSITPRAECLSDSLISSPDVARTTNSDWYCALDSYVLSAADAPFRLEPVLAGSEYEPEFVVQASFRAGGELGSSKVTWRFNRFGPVDDHPILTDAFRLQQPDLVNAALSSRFRQIFGFDPRIRNQGRSHP